MKISGTTCDHSFCPRRVDRVDGTSPPLPPPRGYQPRVPG